MKKFFSFVVIAAMSVSMVGCGGEAKKEEKKETTTTTTTTNTETPKPTEPAPTK